MTSNPKRIYLIGSMRNENIPLLGRRLRALGHEVHDEWYAPGPNADDYWRDYETAKGNTFVDAIKGRHAEEVFNYDKKYIDKADCVVLLMPAGKSAHLEMGYAVGQHKETHIVLDDPDRWDIMYRFLDHVWANEDELVAYLG